MHCNIITMLFPLRDVNKVLTSLRVKGDYVKEEESKVTKEFKVTMSRWRYVWTCAFEYKYHSLKGILKATQLCYSKESKKSGKTIIQRFVNHTRMRLIEYLLTLSLSLQLFLTICECGFMWAKELFAIYTTKQSELSDLVIVSIDLAKYVDFD